LYYVAVQIGPAAPNFNQPTPAYAVPKKEQLMILITGATGTVGRAVLDEVRRTKSPAKAMYRSADDAKNAPE